MTGKSLLFVTAFVDAFCGASAGAKISSKNVDITVVNASGGGTQGIAWVGFSSKTFVGGSGSAGRIVGRLGAIMNPALPAAACSWSLAGADAAKFAVTSSTGVVRIGAADLPPGKYSWNAVCTQAGAVMSPFVQAFSVEALAATVPTIEIGDGPIFSTGDTITFTVRNAPVVPYYVFLGETHGHQDSNAPGHTLFNDGHWEGTLMHTIPPGNSNTTVKFTVPDQKQGPNDAYLQHYIASLSADGNYSGELAESSWFGVNPAYDRQPPAATSPGFADPFTPQHTVTVCPSGCDFTSLHRAVISVQDYTLIKVKAIRKGFYRDCVSIEGPNSGGPGGGAGGPNITHIWIKGVSDDGDFVRLQATPPYTGYYCAEPGSSGGHGVIVIGADPLDVTIENLEISDCDGESNEGCIYLNGYARSGTTVRLRNVYLHDGEDLVSFAGDNPGAHITIENSHFVRGGHNYGGWQHNLYIGGCDPTKGPPCTLDFRHNISEQTVRGHELKTRETTSTVNCNLFKEAYNPLHPGSADIDFSEGRISILTNNLVAMGQAADPNNNNLVRYGLDQEYPPPQNRYFIVQGNLFINDGPPNVGYIEYGPRPYQTALWANTGQVPPGNSTNNRWVGPVGYAGSGSIYFAIPTYALTPLRKGFTFYQLQDVVRVPDNPKYIFAVTSKGITAPEEPPGYSCPGACPVSHGAAGEPGSQIQDGSATLVPILPGLPLPSTGDTLYATRAMAGLGPSDYPMPAACTAPVGNVAVPSN
ncbi:MAG: hypothetical protein JOY83_14470 [Alphaproteobacteria bacterium]|nr:hypothetical protein [Alphaproteobacteria bacterium]